MSIFRPMATQHYNDFSRRMVSMNRAKLEKTAAELATGFRQDVVKDLGMRSSQTYDLRNAMDRVENYQVNNNLLLNKMDMTDTVVGGFREEAQALLDLVITSAYTPSQTAGAIQNEARSTMDSLIARLNTSFNGEYLFSGIDSDMPPLTGYSTAHGVTGFSPEGVVDGVTGGVIVSAADAAAKIAELSSIYDSSNAVIPTRNFEDTFYNGTDLLDGLGNPNTRKTALVDDGFTIEYGMQANDPGFHEVLKGVAMLSSVDISQIGDTAGYQAYMSEVIDSISQGLQDIDVEVAKLAKKQQIVEQTVGDLRDKQDVFNNRILAFEAIDPYEAAARMSSLEMQLEASYAAVARISNLSFLNYMR